MKLFYRFHGILFFLFIAMACDESRKPSEYADPSLKVQVGDIQPNAELDGDFQGCNQGRLPQYYAYKEKPFIKGKLHFENHITTSYKTPKNSIESGLLRIRFVVNCKGESGRFRLLSMNEDYEEISFSEDIVDQLLRLTKEYKDWRVMSYKDFESDYYFYVTFKIKDGQIKEILP